MTRPLTEERRNLHDALCSLPSRREHRAEHATHAEIAGWREALRRAVDACNIVLGEAEPPTMQAARDWRTRAEDAEAIIRALTGADISKGSRVDIPRTRQLIFELVLAERAPAALTTSKARGAWLRAVEGTREACAQIAEQHGSDVGKIIAACIRKGEVRAANPPASRVGGHGIDCPCTDVVEEGEEVCSLDCTECICRP